MKNLLLIFLLVWANQCYSKDILAGTLNGTLVTFDTNGKEIPVSGRDIQIFYENNKFRTAARTNDNGDFTLHIKSNQPIVQGRKLKLIIKGDEYFILSPYNGELFPPESLTSYELKVIAVSNGSRTQTGPLYAEFTNRDRTKIYQRQLYTVQVISTSSNAQAIKVRDLFISNHYDSFIDAVEEDDGSTFFKVYVSKSNNWEQTNKLKRKIRRIFNGRYSDAFVKSILY
jgi:hypothetical protein